MKEARWTIATKGTDMGGRGGMHVFVFWGRGVGGGIYSCRPQTRRSSRYRHTEYRHARVEGVEEMGALARHPDPGAQAQAQAQPWRPEEHWLAQAVGSLYIHRSLRYTHTYLPAYTYIIFLV